MTEKRQNDDREGQTAITKTTQNNDREDEAQ